MAQSTKDILGGDSEGLLTHVCKTIPKDQLHLPGPDFVDRIFVDSDRNNRVLGNLEWIFQHGRLAGTGYVSILPVDQGIEHTAGASFAPNPIYFDPENIVKLAIEGGCNAVASTLGVLGAVARRYAHKIPFIVKINHNELLTYPNKYDQMPVRHRRAGLSTWARPRSARPSTSAPRNPRRQIEEVSEAFARAHELGMVTVLWCYLRNNAFKKDGIDYHVAADLTGQANHLGVTIQADIIKQKLPENNGGFNAVEFRQDPPGKCTAKLTHRPPDRPRAAIRWRTATWAASGSSTRAAPRARTTSRRPSARRSSTSAPAAWA